MATLRLLFGLLLGALLMGATAMAVPMHGTYTIGDGTPADSFTSFTAAVSALTTNGVDGPVTFDVEELTYSEFITIGAITGASATNTITFHDAGTLDTRPKIYSVSGTAPAVNLNGSQYITFDGIDITLTVNGKVVQIMGHANYNTIKNCTLTGSGLGVGTNYGVYMTGGNDYNVIENVTVNRTILNPVYLWGKDWAWHKDLGNEVRNCTLLGGMVGVYLYYQEGAVVSNCDIQPGYVGTTGRVKGISCDYSALVQFYGNKIHNIQGGGVGSCWGIFLETDNESALLFNNFVYDFVRTGTGRLYGIEVDNGTAELYFNSVYIGDVGLTGSSSWVYGFYEYVSGMGTAVVLKNNIFQITEPTLFCWAIYMYDGALTSDYNCVYGTGTNYYVGEDVPGNDYATLALWQAGTGLDLNSVEGNPGFVSATDLHIDSLATLVDSAGTPIAGITDDIDGDVRNVTFPDIGADEYTAVYPPEVVDSLTILPDADAGDAALRWAPAVRANSYKIYRGTEYGFVIDGTSYVGETASTTYTDVGVLATAGSKYYVVVASTDPIAR